MNHTDQLVETQAWCAYQEKQLSKRMGNLLGKIGHQHAYGLKQLVDYAIHKGVLEERCRELRRSK